jgi:hypothetical protein
MTRYIAFIIIGLFMSACYEFSLKDPKDTSGTDGSGETGGAEDSADGAGEGGTGGVKGVGSIGRTQPGADASGDAEMIEVGCPEDNPVDCGSYCCPTQYPKCGGCGFDCCPENVGGTGGQGGSGGTGGAQPAAGSDAGISGSDGTGGIVPVAGSGGEIIPTGGSGENTNGSGGTIPPVGGTGGGVPLAGGTGGGESVDPSTTYSQCFDIDPACPSGLICLSLYVSSILPGAIPCLEGLTDCFCTKLCNLKGDATQCPDPPNGTAQKECLDFLVAGGLEEQGYCSLDCSDGRTCPLGMSCISYAPNLNHCQW